MITLGQRQTNNINQMITLTVITLSGFHCIILYNKEYDLEQKYSDDEGRQHIAVIGNDERKFIVVNGYFPNDHKQGMLSKCTPKYLGYRLSTLIILPFLQGI